MAVKISELPNLTSASLTSVSSIIPVVANLGAAITTYSTSMANVKTYVETGNLAVTGFITAQTDSSFGANVTIDGNLVVQGNTTVIGANNLGVTDNLIEIHLANAANVSEPWTYDDGRDIGIRMHYFKGTNDNAALFWDNGTRQLIWAESGVSESSSNIGAGYVLGAVLTGSTIAANNTATTGNGTGALQSHGGASITGNIWVGGESTVIGNLALTGEAIVGGLIQAQGNITTPARMSTGNLNVNSFVTIGTTIVAGGAATVNALTSNTSGVIGTTLNVGSSTTVNSLTVNTSGTFGTTLSANAGIQNTAIGNVTANTGAFTTLSTTGAVTLGGDVLVTGNANPSANATYSLGNLTYRWADIYASGTITANATYALYADLAEMYVPDQFYDPGTVVIFGGEQEITVTDQQGDTRVAGAISTQPAYVMNEAQENGIALALRGKVPVKVVGPVNKGDLLITSNVAGYATAAKFYEPSPNAVFAKSLERDDSSEPRVIWAVIL